MIVIPAGDKSDLVGAYVSDKTGISLTPGMYQALAVLNDNNDFVAGVVVSDYRGHDCQISCATETSAAWRDSVMRAVFSYIFLQLGCVRCTSLTRKSNKRARGFLEGLGFKLEGTIRLGYDGVKDALIYGYLASECKYIQPLEPEAGQVLEPVSEEAD